MKCQICNTNNANILFTQIINNEKIVMQICSECAKKKGLTLEITMEAPTQVDSLVGSLTGDIGPEMYSEINGTAKNSVPDITCPECSLTFEEFKKSGLFGCDTCHEAFGSHIANLLKQIHGLAKHEGKSPQALPDEFDVKKELKELQSKLKRSVELEEYERAAEIRDRISSLEKERGNHEF